MLSFNFMSLRRAISSSFILMMSSLVLSCAEYFSCKDFSSSCFSVSLLFNSPAKSSRSFSIFLTASAMLSFFSTSALSIFDFMLAISDSFLAKSSVNSLFFFAISACISCSSLAWASLTALSFSFSAIVSRS